jgi:hypothetical protein
MRVAETDLLDDEAFGVASLVLLLASSLSSPFDHNIWSSNSDSSASKGLGEERAKVPKMAAPFRRNVLSFVGFEDFVLVVEELPVGVVEDISTRDSISHSPSSLGR